MIANKASAMSTNKMIPTQGFLVLETGEAFAGAWHGGKERAGEVVFNTSHSGYEEMATDPSYMHQILVLTAPMQGNYGVSDQDWESRQIWIEGYICVQMQDSHQNPSWKRRLVDHGVAVMSDLDTRSLVLRLREGGTTWGALVQGEDESEALSKAKALIAESKKVEDDWVWKASRKTVEFIKGQNSEGPKLAVVDFGSKENILRELVSRVRELVVFPSRTSAEEILSHSPDGLMLTNGPGDPKHVQVAVETLQKLIGKLPIFGICMGHQILALSLGGKTYKLRFGHRGSNHPIRDEILNQIYVTSQNHGYAVEAESLPSDVKITHWNLNDKTVAGFYSAERKLLGIQYHPEACPGPHEARRLFDFFISEMVGAKK